jgi:hypothetical protein
MPSVQLGLALWTSFCLAGIAFCARRVSEEQLGLLYLYYQPLVPMLAMLWLWAAAVRFFEMRSVKYEVCFSAGDQKHLLPGRSLFQVGQCPASVSRSRWSVGRSVRTICCQGTACSSWASAPLQSVGRSVGRLVGQSVGQSVSQSVSQSGSLSGSHAYDPFFRKVN